MMEILGVFSSVWFKLLLALLIIWLGIPLVLLFVGFVIYPLCCRVRRWIQNRRDEKDDDKWDEIFDGIE